MLVELILLLVASVAAIYLLYEFRRPALGDPDYWFYSRVYVGRYRSSAETGTLAFLLGMAAFTLRSTLKQVWLSIQANDEAPDAGATVGQDRVAGREAETGGETP